MERGRLLAATVPSRAYRREKSLTRHLIRKGWWLWRRNMTKPFRFGAMDLKESSEKAFFEEKKKLNV
jgi:hypothetical protein